MIQGYYTLTVLIAGYLHILRCCLEIETFKKTVDEFLKTSPYQWQDVIADTGPYSLQNLNYIQLKGMVPVIRSKKNLKTHPIRELKKGYFFIPILFQNGGQTITFLISIVFDA